MLFQSKLYNLNTFIFIHSCVGCSKFVRNDFLNNREKFLLGTMNNPYYLEKLCEIDKLINNVKIDDTINIEFDDF